jgi:hypothetical protein
LKDQRLAVTQEGRKLTARVEADTVKGTLVGPDGKELTFTAHRTAPNSLAGLYRGVDRFDGDEHVLGWIVDQKHDVVGSVTVRRGPRVIKVVVLRPVKRLPPPPIQIEVPAEQPPAQDEQQIQVVADQQSQQAQEVLQAQVDPSAKEVVQAQRVVIPRKLPMGKKIVIVKPR